MKYENYKEKVRQIISHKAGMEPKEVLEDMFFGDDLNLGDLEVTEILDELEDLFKIEIMDEQENIESVRDLFELLEEKLE